jgi:hypothetical protein
MKNAAKRKPSEARNGLRPDLIPSLLERAEAIYAELDAEIDRLAEEHRPKGTLRDTAVVGVQDFVGALSADDMRLGWELRAKGIDLLAAYKAALKETNA